MYIDRIEALSHVNNNVETFVFQTTCIKLINVMLQ